MVELGIYHHQSAEKVWILFPETDSVIGLYKDRFTGYPVDLLREGDFLEVSSQADVHREEGYFIKINLVQTVNWQQDGF